VEVSKPGEEYMRVKFKATVEQVLQMAANAANNSIPVGYEVLAFDGTTTYKPGDFILHGTTENGCIYIDYAEGRMVKFSASVFDNVWDMREPRFDYQSWIGTYPTARDLIESVGAEVIEEEALANYSANQQWGERRLK
jgi:hypothetical protein